MSIWNFRLQYQKIQKREKRRNRKKEDLKMSSKGSRAFSIRTSNNHTCKKT